MPEDKTLLTDAAIAAQLADLPGWRRDDVFLKKDFVFANYKEINQFLPFMTRTIVALNHHPDFEFVGGEKRVSFVTTTHSAGCLTQADLSLAKALNGWRAALA